MSTKYFILSKQNEDINVNQNQIYFINNDLTYIMISHHQYTINKIDKIYI
jgi:hypothetical protein